MGGVLDLHAIAGWAYLAIFLITVVDGFFPVVPAETTIITGAALAAGGHLQLAGVLASTWTAVIVGDLITHEMARRGRGRLLGRWQRRDRPRRVLAWVTEVLQRRGMMVVTVGRFVPLGRTAVSLASGYAAVPRARYLVALVLGGTAWTLYEVGLGYLGGNLLDNPLVSVAIGIGLSLTITSIGAIVQRLRKARSRRTRPAPPVSPATHAVSVGAGTPGSGPGSLTDMHTSLYMGSVA
jgi:membrane-associated protein